MRVINLTGMRFGRWLVLDRADNRGSHVVWRCRCECGRIRSVYGQFLRGGGSRGCKSCANTTHGLKKHYLYRTWENIKKRTTNKSHRQFKDYGGRGIQLCSEWLNDPAAFIRWILAAIGDRPDGMSLDRIDNGGNYEPGNLRWADRKTQRHNRRSDKCAS